jgi:hypothetical protein
MYDRAAFLAVVRGFINPPLFVSGHGSYESPWQLRWFGLNFKAEKRHAPSVISLGDDPDGVFQTSPHSPIDLAVLFKNLQRLGVKKVASATVMAWDKPDPIGLVALEMSLARFESLVVTTPLARGAIAETMPPSFRRASIPLSEIEGKGSVLPMVNRIPIPGVVLGGETGLAGFSVLESEPPTAFRPLLARWEDRVVFSFPLLAALQRLNLPPSGVQVRLGQYLKLSPAGPIVPIDDYGCLAMKLKPIPALTEVSADQLIDRSEALFPADAPAPVILRDDRSAADPAVHGFSSLLASTVAVLTSDEGVTEARAYPRLAQNKEIGILAAWVLLLTAFCATSSFVRFIGIVVAMSACFAAQRWASEIYFIWLPGLAMQLASLAAYFMSGLVSVKSLPPTPLTEPVLEPAPEPARLAEMESAPKFVPKPKKLRRKNPESHRSSRH